MSITYIGDLSTSLDEVRFEIGDTVDNYGPKPGTGAATNYTDAELSAVIAREGSVGRALGVLYQNLATLWAKHIDSKIGPRDEKLSQIAARYASLAKEKKAEFGSAGTDIVLGYFIENLDQGEDENVSDWL